MEQPLAPLASLVIPAHNEERVIGRLLDRLGVTGGDPTFETIVVCNGCTDGTVEVARAAGVQVVDLATPSKRDAQRHGDELSTAFPRVYLDADVELDRASLLALLDRLDDRTLAVAPRRELPRTGVSRLVRWYYDVWEALPQVRGGLFGRGVIAVTEAGNDRIRQLPPMMSDDLVMSEAFGEGERAVVDDAVVIVHPPRRISDLLRRRIRVATGNSQADGEGLRTDGARTSMSVLLQMARRDLRIAVRMPVFLGVTVIARVAAKRAVKQGRFDTWLRDESSRA